MEKPSLKINGETVYMDVPTMRTWRELTKLGDAKDIDTFCKVVALSFNLKDDVVDDLPADEIIPTAVKCIQYVNEKINEKLKGINEKNGEKEGV